MSQLQQCVCVPGSHWQQFRCPLALKEIQRSSLLLTCHTDHGSAHTKVHHQLKMLRHSGHNGRDDDLSCNIELESIREEDAYGVQQLHRLVQPAESVCSQETDGAL